MKKIFALMTAGALALLAHAKLPASRQQTPQQNLLIPLILQPPKTMVLFQAKRSLSSARSQPAAEPTLVPAILHRLFLK